MKYPVPWRVAGSILTAACVLSVTAVVWASHQSLGSELLFSLKTDKPVYYYSEPIRVEVLWTNPTDVDWFRVSTCGYCYATVDVIDVTTDPVQYLSVYTTTLRFIGQSNPGHAELTFGIAEIPAYKLKSGNRKYKLILNLVQQLKRNSDNTTVYQVATNASTVITIR